MSFSFHEALISARGLHQIQAIEKGAEKNP